jgi:two-component system cell cycle sensor histidine kinase PleC
MPALVSTCRTELSGERPEAPPSGQAVTGTAAAITRRGSALLESVATPIVITAQQDGAVLFVNAAARKLFALGADTELAGAPDAPHLSTRYYADPAARRDLLDELAATGQVSNREIAFVSARGDHFWGLLSGQPTSFDGIPALLSSIVDISAQKARENQLAEVTNQLRAQAAETLLLNRELQRQQQMAITANRAKSDFLARMSHELRSPLNAILGFSEIIGDDLFGAAGRERYQRYAGDIHAAGKHLLALINDILDLSKVEAGRLELKYESVDVGELIRACLPIVAPVAERRGVEITAQLDPAIRIEADHLRLRQMVLNLLSNAVKFTLRDGKVGIRAALRGDELEIVVTDNGIGMSPEQIEVALQPFGQVVTESPYAQVGTGLGLPIVISLVELHGGRFAIDSAPNMGTTVTLVLPRQRPVPDLPSQPA